VQFFYNRGFSSVFPIASVWSGDTAGATITHYLLRRVSVHANATYMRGSTLMTSYAGHTGYGSTGIDYLPQRNMVFSVSYMLVSQRIADPSFQQPSLHRNTVTASMTYYLPSLRGEHK
jgi:hypothetical protein